MADSNQEKQNLLLSRLDNNREWLLKNIDCGRWPELRSELAYLERELSKFILRVKEYNSEKN